MEAEERLRAVAVLGAGGKMGSGIAWVALKAMAELDARENGVPGSGRFDLALIDANPTAFRRLRSYLESQLRKTAEKGIGDLRAWAKDRADLIENAGDHRSLRGWGPFPGALRKRSGRGENSPGRLRSGLRGPGTQKGDYTPG